MTALVNGGAWAGQGEPSPTTATFYETDHTLVLGGVQAGVSPKTRGISIDVKNVVEPGSYPLAAASDGLGSALYSESDGTLDGGDFTLTFYWTSATRTGTLAITEMDMTRHTISGTFRFDAETPEGRLVRITGGAFSGQFASFPGSAPN